MPAKPILDGLALQQVEAIEGFSHWDRQAHRVPALEGDLLQSLGRRAVRISLRGVLSGAQAGQSLKGIRAKFRAAQPVSFVADVATATKIARMLVEEIQVRELAGRPERFEYAITLVEYLGPGAAKTAAAAAPPPAAPSPDSGSLQVEVRAEQGGLNARAVDVSIDGIGQAGKQFSQSLSDRSAHVWNAGALPPGWYRVNAVSAVPPMVGTAEVAVQHAQTTRVSVTLRSDLKMARGFVVHFPFGKAFLEPGMVAVLEEAAAYARSHRDEMVAIVGHTDLTGPEPQNQLLSERRARAVFACLTQSAAEWDALRQADSWGRGEFDAMLSGLGYADLESFRRDQGLPADGGMNDASWTRLLRAYMGRISSPVPEDRIVTMPGEAGPRKWEGRGGEEPVRNTIEPWRPNRRTELIFMRQEDLNREGEWLLYPAELGSLVVRGSIRLEDGTPLANARYFLTAPDGEYMDGECARGLRRGRPIAGTTAADGTFTYPDRPKGIGIYTLEVAAPFSARLAGAAGRTAGRRAVWKRLEPATGFDVVVAGKPADTVRKGAATPC